MISVKKRHLRWRHFVDKIAHYATTLIIWKISMSRNMKILCAYWIVAQFRAIRSQRKKLSPFIHVTIWGEFESETSLESLQVTWKYTNECLRRWIPPSAKDLSQCVHFHFPLMPCLFAVPTQLRRNVLWISLYFYCRFNFFIHLVISLCTFIEAQILCNVFFHCWISLAWN